MIKLIGLILFGCAVNCYAQDLPSHALLRIKARLEQNVSNSDYLRDDGIVANISYQYNHLAPGLSYQINDLFSQYCPAKPEQESTIVVRIDDITSGGELWVKMSYSIIKRIPGSRFRGGEITVVQTRSLDYELRRNIELWNRPDYDTSKRIEKMLQELRLEQGVGSN